MSKTKKNYHHGDLRSCILQAATEMITEHGVDALSFRKLAEKVNVSRTAAYHHFKDKNDLLNAIATQGFITWQQQAEAIFTHNEYSNEEKFRQFVHAYVLFAINNPAIYELMFGKTLWKNNSSSQPLKDVAYPSFQYQLKMTKQWQQQKILNPHENTLRLAQVTWATLHGLTKLMIDGIYADKNHIEEMCDCAANTFLYQPLEPHQ